MLDAARNDVPHEGFVYGAGSYALANEHVTFAIDLEPGQWQIAISRQASEQGEEIMQLFPLTVTAEEAMPGATPLASSAAGTIPAAVTRELRDVAFGGMGQRVPAGPQVWQVTNVGNQPR